MAGQIRDILRQKIVDSQAAPLPDLTQRDIRIPSVPGKGMAVIGMRRSGKTTFLWQQVRDRLAEGIPREGVLFFGFEDERLAGMTADDLGLVVEEYYRLHPGWRDGKRAVFLFDEIQVVPGWETFARRLLDTERIELFLSGSSARLLSREVATSMRGRAMEVTVYPFSFREALRHQGREPETSPDRWTKSTRSALDNDLRTYLVHGGFPEAQGLNARDRVELLRSYVDVALLRDVVERHRVSRPFALRWMVRQLLGNAGGTFSVNRFHNDLKSQGVAVAKDTLHDYLGYLEDAFLLRTLQVASGSERRRMVNPRKAYPVDPGLIPVFERSGKPNLGHALETCILLELERRGAEVHYVRTAGGCEVDFLARDPEGRQSLIQVCASMDDPDTAERETRALLDAAHEFPEAGLLVIGLDFPASVELPAGMVFQSAVEWILAG